MDHRYDILGIGNAIMDLVAPVEDAFITRYGLTRGAMRLVDAADAERLTAELGAGAVESGGGSAANTCVVAAGMGARVAFVGKVGDDGLGERYRLDLAGAGVSFVTPALPNGQTGRCLIAVTPDGQRTMNTFLGAATAFAPWDVDEAVVTDAAVVYLEGYLFDPPPAQAAFRQAAAAAREAGRLVALSLSDPFCVHRHRDAFQAFIQGGVDILFANEAEIGALFETDTFSAAAERARDVVRLAVLTRGPLGSIILRGPETFEVRAEPTNVVDTTGAGDAYAAGFLVGHARGLPLAECGRLGSVAAAEVISHFGARPLAPIAGGAE